MSIEASGINFLSIRRILGQLGWRRICFFTGGYTILVFNLEILVWTIIAGVCIGVGFGFTIPLTNHMTVEKSNTNTRAKHLGYFSSATFLGQFLSSFIEGISLDTSIIYFITAVSSLLISGLFLVYMKKLKHL